MKKMRRGDHEIALKKPEQRTTWDLLQIFFATVQYGSYKTFVANRRSALPTLWF